MSRRRGPQAGSKRPLETPPAKESIAYRSPPAKAPIDFRLPLKPQKKLLVILSVIFALWLATLLALYFATPSDQRRHLTNTAATLKSEI